MFEQGMYRFTGTKRAYIRFILLYYFREIFWFRLYTADPSVSCGQIGSESAALHCVHFIKYS